MQTLLPEVRVLSFLQRTINEYQLNSAKGCMNKKTQNATKKHRKTIQRRKAKKKASIAKAKKA